MTVVSFLFLFRIYFVVHAIESATKFTPKGRALWLYLPAMMMLLLLSGCSAATVQKDRSGRVPSGKECRALYRELKADITTWGSPERVKKRLISVFQSVGPDCGIRDRLFRNALKKGRGNMGFLAGLGYALFSEEFAASTEEFELWKVEVWKDDLRHEMLAEADRARSLYMAGRITKEEYQEAVDLMIEFSVWNLDKHWLQLGAEDVPGMHPADILVEDLDLLSHSASTLAVYFSRYSDHEVLGNMRNFEMMRTSMNELFETDTGACEIIRDFSSKGVLVLDVEHPFVIQTATAAEETGEYHAPTSAPSFLHDPDSGSIDRHVMIEVPVSKAEPFRRWPGGYSYFVRPIPREHRSGERRDESVFLEARVRVDERPEADPHMLIRNSRREGPNRSGTVSAWLKNPIKARMVGYVESGFFKEKEKSCGINAPYLANR